MLAILYYRLQAAYYRACTCFWRGVEALLRMLSGR